MLGIITSKNRTMIATHTIQDITFDQYSLQLIIDGKHLKISLDKISSKLKSADDLQRNFYKISPSGYGIHWPLIDEDLSVDALIKTAAQ
jgi:hypothetical protein